MAEAAAHSDYKALYEQSQLQVVQLRHELDQLKKMIFGARQERFVSDQSADAAQLSMGLSVQPVAATSLIKTQKIEYKRTTSILTSPVTTHQGRMKLPDHLERKEILVDVEGTAGCRRIGEEVTEELEYEPGRLYVNRYVRPKYVSADNQTILIAPLPEHHTVAIGCKNYLFAGSHEAAQRSAMLYSLLGTCKLHDINPFEWMKAGLEQIPAHPINKIQQLLPHCWKPLQ